MEGARFRLLAPNNPHPEVRMARRQNTSPISLLHQLVPPAEIYHIAGGMYSWEEKMGTKGLVKGS